MRSVACIAIFIGCSGLSGCALCPPGYIDDYAARGGKWQRTNATSGRVGSILSDPGSIPSDGAEVFYDESYGGDYYGDSYETIPANPTEIYPADELEGESIMETPESTLELDDM